MYRITLDPRVTQKYPDYSTFVIYAQNLSNTENDPKASAILRAAEEAARTWFGADKPATHPHIAAWRQTFQSFGLKPSKYLCSAEALLSRVLKGQNLPDINRVVDLYNAVSLQYVVPTGGEDWDKLSSDLRLTFAMGDEPFDAMQDGQAVISHPETSEVVWADSTGVTCRAWNWRQCYRTRLTADTTNAYFIFDRIAPMSVADVRAAGETLIGYLKEFSPDSTITSELLGQQE